MASLRSFGRSGRRPKPCGRRIVFMTFLCCKNNGEDEKIEMTCVRSQFKQVQASSSCRTRMVFWGPPKNQKFFGVSFLGSGVALQHFPSKALLRIGAKQPYSRPGAASRHFPRFRLAVERAGRSDRASIASPTRGETRDQRQETRIQSSD